MHVQNHVNPYILRMLEGTFSLDAAQVIRVDLRMLVSSCYTGNSQYSYTIDMFINDVLFRMALAL